MGIGEGVNNRKKVDMRGRSRLIARAKVVIHQGAQVDRDLQAARGQPSAAR